MMGIKLAYRYDKHITGKMQMCGGRTYLNGGAETPAATWIKRWEKFQRVAVQRRAKSTVFWGTL
jgi:hypothetical protein